MELPYTGIHRTDVELQSPKDKEASPPGRNMQKRAPTSRMHDPPTNMRLRSLRPSSPQEGDFRGFPDEGGREGRRESIEGYFTRSRRRVALPRRLEL
ncbi:hypothetical protein PR048_000181 [Dryococelus australis]|uniref:Uncharacterized protein n=1 Tax=Dryococelus australis TaxID=614101 RepID=A0ABQ9IDX1_9NEOP|nr:hypothetical protein PR048_000181 [Dryococelus australis]